MATSQIKEESRRSINLRRHDDRESVIFAKRHLLSPSDFREFDFDQKLSDVEFQALLQTFRKPNNKQCLEALKKLNRLFFGNQSASGQIEWINAFFVDCDRTVHNLVGIFTNSNLDDSRIQPEAGVCLANLCCTKDQKQQLILARLATPYFVSYLADGIETTRISLALASLHGLNNLAAEAKENKKLSQYLESQNSLEAIGAIIGHNNDQIREAAFSALESIAQFQAANSEDSLSASVKNLLRYQPGFVSILLDGIESNISGPARTLFLLATLDESAFPTPAADQIHKILIAIGNSKLKWDLATIFPLWRAIGALLVRDQINFSTESVSAFFDLVLTFLQSPYVPVRKETLWVVSNFVASQMRRQLLVDLTNLESSGQRLEPLVSVVVDIGTLTLCKETLELCLRVLHSLLSDTILERLSDSVRCSVLSKLKAFLGSLDQSGDQGMHDLIYALAALFR